MAHGACSPPSTAPGIVSINGLCAEVWERGCGSGCWRRLPKTRIGTGACLIACLIARWCGRIRVRRARKKRGGASARAESGRLQVQNPPHGRWGGTLLRVRLTADPRHDSTPAHALLDGFPFGFPFTRVLADRESGRCGRGLCRLRRGAGQRGRHLPASTGQHQRANIKRAYDHWRYRECHLIECGINKRKHFRRVFSRFDQASTSWIAPTWTFSTLSVRSLGYGESSTEPS